MKNITFPATTELRSVGLRGQDESSYSRSKAVSHGLRLCALSGNIWPRKGMGFIDLVSEEIRVEIVSFSIHARRHLEINKLFGLQCNGPLINFRGGLFVYENDIWKAVNAVLHHRTLDVKFLQINTVKHQNLGDQALANLVVTSDRSSDVAICPQGLVYGFINSTEYNPTLHDFEGSG